MNKALILMLASTALAVSACKKNDSATSASTANQDVAMADNGATSNDMAAATALPTTAPEFVNAAAASDRFEIESSKLAKASGSSAAIKSFANQMITAHTATSAKLKSTAAAMTPALTPNDTLNADQQALMSGLQGKTGAELDSAYKDAQVTAHQKTLDMLNAYASGGDNPQLQALAKGMIPTVTAHLNLAKGLK